MRDAIAVPAGKPFQINGRISSSWPVVTTAVVFSHHRCSSPFLRSQSAEPRRIGTLYSIYSIRRWGGCLRCSAWRPGERWDGASAVSRRRRKPTQNRLGRRVRAWHYGPDRARIGVSRRALIPLGAPDKNPPVPLGRRGAFSKRSGCSLDELVLARDRERSGLVLHLVVVIALREQVELRVHHHVPGDQLT